MNAIFRDRACGALLGTAAGDALGAGYEFQGPRRADEPVAMIGGGLGPFAPGEWTDDTAMAIAIAETAATGADLRDDAALDVIVRRWAQWSATAKDVGVQTRTVLATATTAQAARAASAALHARTGRTAGNGSLMRAAPVALAYLDDEAGLAQAARAVSDLTHHDPDAADACVLWCAAIRHAVHTGELDVRIGLGLLDAERRGLWSARIEEAEAAGPAAFTAGNGWVVAALQAAWSAIVHTPAGVDEPGAGVFRADQLRRGLEAAVRGGGDTDTVAAIAGGLLGAAHGAAAVPGEWRRILHGWPGLRTRGLVALADRIVTRGAPDGFDYTYGGFRGSPAVIAHPHDDRVFIGGISAIGGLPEQIDAVVSLCRVADEDLPAGVEQLDVRLIDRDGENAHLDFVLLDTVRVIEQLREEGRSVFVHCVQAHSRTPTIAALYGARRAGISADQALREVVAVLPESYPRHEFRSALGRLAP
ncbi:ADP-ribosylglycohydrolase family protein [Mycobacterium sp. 1274756.6]|uniref:ADP-ribosylglycohydrolase family protein n=1 Tax=Mycobacterium sp. 1274756.6 TaxID=1834076 RepID=UPI0007FFC468|nr:ADP-ribosylglycohydrolase family protein [Mycobacterium sp. 1274756.6]OBJ70999.1 ribosylglycohydrolase [Mycobacterium sp. 1274756.6]